MSRFHEHKAEQNVKVSIFSNSLMLCLDVGGRRGSRVKGGRESNLIILFGCFLRKEGGGDLEGFELLLTPHF